ncbi:MAG: hypothetical protein SF053_19365 [Bacteroidia bacterium]|nr:hypothetical protein [Bacteroidia bacterium]
MKYATSILMALATLWLGNGCTSEQIHPDTLPPIVFSLEYRNAAWVHQHNGVLFDESGRVYTFDLPVGWHMPDPQTGLIAGELLAENRSKAVSTIQQVSSTDWLRWQTDAAKAAGGMVTTPVNSANDMGSWVWSAYIPDTATGLFRQILLEEAGDFSRENTSAAARRLVQRINHYR